MRKAEAWPQPAAAAARSLGSAVGQGENYAWITLDSWKIHEDSWKIHED